MRKIDGTPKSLRELFTGVKYTIHYYQREYQWQTKQIEELLDDLLEEFNDFYSESDERSKVDEYGHYFMGSIVLTADDNAIIDGQQRLTSLTLLLIYLYHKLNDIKAEKMEINREYYEKYKSILSAKKLSAYIIAEKGFKKHLIQKTKGKK